MCVNFTREKEYLLPAFLICEQMVDTFRRK
jgi:hypothetical protein